MSLETICQKCHAGIMQEYERKMTNKKMSGTATVRGKKCDRCGYIKLDDDDDVWSVVGL